MRSTLAPLILAVFLGAAPTARAGTELGPLPAGGTSHSSAGPSAELIGFLLFDPALIADRVPAGVRLRTLAEKAHGWPRLTAYLDEHPERRAWAWSFYEIIGIRAARYDGVPAKFDAGRGGMAVWYPELVRTDDSESRPLGVHNLALGSWVSDENLASMMRARGFPAHDARVTFITDAKLASGTLATAGLTIRGECGLEGRPFVPWWGKDKHSYETMWTPVGEGDTFEIVTWAGHRSRRCVDAAWRVTGTDPFASCSTTRRAVIRTSCQRNSLSVTSSKARCTNGIRTSTRRSPRDSRRIPRSPKRSASQRRRWHP